MTMTLVGILLTFLASCLSSSVAQEYTYVPGSLSFASPIPTDGSTIRMEGYKRVLRFASCSQTYTIQAQYRALLNASSLAPFPSSASWGFRFFTLTPPLEFVLPSAPVGPTLGIAQLIETQVPPVCRSLTADVTHPTKDPITGQTNISVTVVTISCQINAEKEGTPEPPQPEIVQGQYRYFDHGRNKPLRVTFGTEEVWSTDLMEWAPPVTSDASIGLIPFNQIADNRLPDTSCGSYRAYNAIPFPQVSPKMLILPRTVQEFLVIDGITGIPVDPAFYGSQYNYLDENTLIHFGLIAQDSARMGDDQLVLFKKSSSSSRMQPFIMYPDAQRLRLMLESNPRVFGRELNYEGEFRLIGPSVDVITQIINRYGYYFKLVLIAGRMRDYEQEQNTTIQQDWTKYPNTQTNWIIDTTITLAFQPPPRIDYAVGCATTAADRSPDVQGCATAGGENLTLFGDHLYSGIHTYIGARIYDIPLSVTINALPVTILAADVNGTWMTIRTLPGQGSFIAIDVISNNIHVELATAPTISYALPTIYHMQSDACHSACTADASTTCLKLETCQRRTNGTQTLMIRGFNLGTRANVLVGAIPCRNVTLLIPHQLLQCVLPDGTDENLNVVVSVAGLSSVVGPTLSYTQCQAGTYQVGLDCITCPDGEYSDRPSQSSCTPAAPGQHVQQDRKAVLPCAPGSYSNVTHAMSCDPCPVGRYTAATGQSQCQVAEAGKFVDVTGATSAKQCPRGTYQPATQQSMCIPCEPGYRNEADGQTQCIPCLAGTYTNSSGSITCSPCSNGTAAATPGQSVCQECPAGRYQDEQGKSSCVACDDNGRQEYVILLPNGKHDCRPCPSGARCSSGIIIATDDVWLARQLDTTVESFTCQPGKCVECPNPTTTAAANGTSINNSNSTMGNQSDNSNKTSSSFSLIDIRPVSSVAAVRFCCAEYRENAINNPLCGRCIPGYQEWGGRCVSCTSTNYAVLAGLVIASWLYVAAFIFICQSNDGLVNIFMYFAATAYLVIGPNTSALSWISFFQFGIFSSGASTCVAAISWRDKLILSLLSPLIAMAQLAVIMFVYSMYRTIQWRRHVNAEAKFRWRVRPFFRTMIALLLFSFTQTAATVAKFMSCQQVTNQGVTDSYIISSPAVSCTSDEYRSLLPLFIVMGLLLVIILPLSIFVYIWMHRDRLHERHMLAIFGVAYETYRSDRYLYELAVLLRRAVLVSLSVALVNDRVQMYTSMTIANIGILGIHVVVHPFKTKTENFMESLSLLVLSMITTVLNPAATNLSTGYTVLLNILVLGTGICLLGVILYHKYQHVQQLRHGGIRKRMSMDQSYNKEINIEMGTTTATATSTAAINVNDINKDSNAMLTASSITPTGPRPLAEVLPSPISDPTSGTGTASNTPRATLAVPSTLVKLAVPSSNHAPSPSASFAAVTPITSHNRNSSSSSSAATGNAAGVVAPVSSNMVFSEFDPEHPFAYPSDAHQHQH